MRIPDRAAVALAVALALASAAAAQASTQSKTAELCALIESAAARHDLPADYLARLIWKESRFDVKARSPKGAQGVAQFMPDTAKLRGLENPWDPAQAIPASAAYLADLRRRFGNLGLAAAAYNSGEKRVEAWLAGRGGLPAETRDYVLSITARPADWFRDPAREADHPPLVSGTPFAKACAALPVKRTRAVAVAEPDGPAPWGAMIAAGPTRAAAHKAYESLARAHAGVVGRYRPLFLRNRNSVRGAWSVRLAAVDRAEARRICDALRARSGFCIVMQN